MALRDEACDALNAGSLHEARVAQYEPRSALEFLQHDPWDGFGFAASISGGHGVNRC